MASDPFTHAAQSLRSSDRDRYLATLVLPPQARTPITALYAFNADIASIRDRVSGPAPGEVRLQWWNDAITGDGHGAVRQHPLADALLQTIERYELPTGTFSRLIAARRFDLYDDPMPDLLTFEGYAGETAATLLQLSAMILNNGVPVEQGDAAGHLGVAQAMIGHLRALGHVSSEGRIMLPWSILEANGVHESELFAGQDSEGLHAALSQIAELAADHLVKASLAIRALPAPLRSAFAIIAVLQRQLHLWTQSSQSPFAPPPDPPAWQKIARLTWWSLQNR